jgi:hypothetical protein
MKILKRIIKFLVILAVAYATFVPALPLYYKWFVPFPKLEEATVYNGILSVEGKISLSKSKCNNALKYYVTDSAGKHEIYYGLPGCRESIWSYPSPKAAIGTFWLHPTFGVIQADYRFNFIKPKFKDTGEERNIASYERIKEKFEHQFDYKNALLRACPFMLLLVYLFYTTMKLFLNLKTAK